MTAPLYQELQLQYPDKRHDAAHTGLWFDRFFNRYLVKGQEWAIPKPDNSQDAKRDWIKTVCGPVGRAEQLIEHANRQTALVHHLQGRSQRFCTDWHFVTGMGNPHPVENGFCWHPTLGVPYLAGSAVKGLVRAWVESNDDGLSEDLQKIRLKRWFGSESKEEVAEQAGGFMFFDAIPDIPPHLQCDIMTPHMRDWYSDGDQGDVNNSKAIPADWHEPVPVPFLAVKKARLVFGIAPRQTALSGELDEIFAALKNALEWLGAGAKTAAGYGYFNLDDDYSQEQEAALARQTQAMLENQRQAMLSPIEKAIEAFLKPIQASEHDTRLLQELEKGTWQGEDAKVVAQKIKTLMQQAGKWIPDFAGTNDKKLKLKQRSQSVLNYLQE